MRSKAPNTNGLLDLVPVLRLNMFRGAARKYVTTHRIRRRSRIQNCFPVNTYADDDSPWLWYYRIANCLTEIDIIYQGDFARFSELKLCGSPKPNKKAWSFHPFEIANKKAEKAMNLARARAYPLLCSVKEE